MGRFLLGLLLAVSVGILAKEDAPLPLDHPGTAVLASSTQSIPLPKTQKKLPDRVKGSKRDKKSKVLTSLRAKKMNRIVEARGKQQNVAITKKKQQTAHNKAKQGIARKMPKKK